MLHKELKHSPQRHVYIKGVSEKRATLQCNSGHISRRFCFVLTPCNPHIIQNKTLLGAHYYFTLLIVETQQSEVNADKKCMYYYSAVKYHIWYNRGSRNDVCCGQSNLTKGRVSWTLCLLIVRVCYPPLVFLCVCWLLPHLGWWTPLYSLNMHKGQNISSDCRGGFIFTLSGFNILHQ